MHIFYRCSNRLKWVVQIAGGVFALLLIVVPAAPAHASALTSVAEDLQWSAVPQSFEAEVPNSPPDDNIRDDDSIRVPIWIPGFDDVDPGVPCSPHPTRHNARFSGNPQFGRLSDVNPCRGRLRLIPWNSPPTPTPADRIRYMPKIT
jgi:hypothetical protein